MLLTPNFFALSLVGICMALPQTVTPPTGKILPPGVQAGDSGTGVGDSDMNPSTNTKTNAEICKLSFIDPESSKSAWAESGAGSILGFYLGKGVEDWSETFFIEEMYRGKQGGATRNCIEPTSSNCGSVEQCKTYKDPGAFFVHQSMVNLHNGLNTMHERLQDEMISALSTDIKEINDMFGPVEANDLNIPFMFSILSGVFTVAGGATAAFPAASGPLTVMSGMMSLFSTIFGQEDGSMTADQSNDDMEMYIGKFFAGYSEVLNSTSGAVFGGDFQNLGDQIDSPAGWIQDTFDDGQMLVANEVDKAVDTLWEGVKVVIDYGLIVTALRNGKYYISARKDISKEDCTATPMVWVNGRCSYIAIQGMDLAGLPSIAKDLSDDPNIPVPLNPEQYHAFTETYGIDYEEAVKNAVDCNDEKDPKFENQMDPGAEFVKKLPKCFVRLKVNEEKATDFSL